MKGGIVKRWIAFGLFALVLASCGVKSERVLTGAPLAPHNGPVAVRMAGDVVPYGFREIAIVRVDGQTGHTKLGKLIAGLQEEARAVGATVIVGVYIEGVSAIGTAGVVEYHPGP